MTFREIPHGSDAYRRECELRQEVLRHPLGLDLYAEDLGAETSQRHFGLFDGEELAACIVVERLSVDEAKLRQMAVSPRMQRCGMGRRFVEQLEAVLVGEGYRTATLHSRASAVDFYAKLGFRVVGGEFEEVGIPHYRMSKVLTLASPTDASGRSA